MCPSRLPDVQPTFAYVPDRPFDNPICFGVCGAVDRVFILS
jgi:hypothetical protein